MKNIINYFYDLKVKEYRKKDSKFIFKIDGIEYEFVEYYGDINKLIEIYKILKSNFIPCYEIIINKKNLIVTLYNNNYYVLLKKQNYVKKLNLFDDILYFGNSINIIGELNWKKFWSYKLDYYIQRIENDKKNVTHFFNYYIALCENAINLINYVNENNLKFTLSHYRIENSEDLINPLNIIIDNRVRDVAEYIKKLFFKYNKKSMDVFELINKKMLSNDEIVLFFSRLLYPSYFFDECEFLEGDILNIERINNITKKNLEYEIYLKEIYIEINKYYNFPQIEFLETK